MSVLFKWASSIFLLSYFYFFVENTHTNYFDPINSDIHQSFKNISQVKKFLNSQLYQTSEYFLVKTTNFKNQSNRNAIKSQNNFNTTEDLPTISTNPEIFPKIDPQSNFNRITITQSDLEKLKLYTTNHQSMQSFLIKNTEARILQSTPVLNPSFSTQLLFRIKLVDNSVFMFSLLLLLPNLDKNQIEKSTTDYLNDILLKLDWAKNTSRVFNFPQIAKILDFSLAINSTYKFPPVTSQSGVISVKNLNDGLEDYMKNGFVTFNSTNIIFTQLLTISTLLGSDFNSTLEYLIKNFESFDKIILFKNISNVCGLTIMSNTLFRNINIPALSLSNNFSVFQNVICSLPDQRNLTSLLDNINKFILSSNNISNQTFAVIANRSVVSLTSPNEFSFALEVFNLPLPANKYGVQKVTLPFQNFTFGTDTIVFTESVPNRYQVLFHIPANVGWVQVTLSENCILPLFVVGKNFIPSIEFQDDSDRQILINATQLGISIDKLKQQNEINITNIAYPEPAFIGSSLYQQTILLNWTEPLDNITGLIGCAYLKPGTELNYTIDIITAAKSVSNYTIVWNNDTNVPIEYQYIVPAGSSITTIVFPVNFPRIMTFNTTEIDKWTLFVDYNTSGVFSNERWSSRNVTRIIPIPAFSLDLLTFTNLDPKNSLVVTIRLSPVISVVTYIGIALGIGLGIGFLTLIGIAIFLIYLRWKEKREEDRQAPHITPEILADLNSNYIPISNYMSSDYAIASTKGFFDSPFPNTATQRTGTNTQDTEDYAVMLSAFDQNYKTVERFLTSASKTDGSDDRGGIQSENQIPSNQTYEKPKSA